MTLVAILTVRRDARPDFQRYERAATRIMSRHRGAIERTVSVNGPADASTFTEIHLVTFPDADSFAAYRTDPELVALADLRDRAIAGSTVFVGENGPVY